MHTGTRQEEVIDHRLTDREWAEEWKHLDHVRKVITFFYFYTLSNYLNSNSVILIVIYHILQVFVTLVRENVCLLTAIKVSFTCFMHYFKE